MRPIAFPMAACLLVIAFSGCSGAGAENQEPNWGSMVKNGKGAIIGTLLDQNNKPIRQKETLLYSRTTNEKYGQVLTSNDGRFWFSVPAGNYRVNVNLKDWDDACEPSSAGVFNNFTMSFKEYGPAADHNHCP